MISRAWIIASIPGMVRAGHPQLVALHAVVPCVTLNLEPYLPETVQTALTPPRPCARINTAYARALYPLALQNGQG